MLISLAMKGNTTCPGCRKYNIRSANHLIYNQRLMHFFSLSLWYCPVLHILCWFLFILINFNLIFTFNNFFFIFSDKFWIVFTGDLYPRIKAGIMMLVEYYYWIWRRSLFINQNYWFHGIFFLNRLNSINRENGLDEENFYWNLVYKNYSRSK